MVIDARTALGTEGTVVYAAPRWRVVGSVVTALVIAGVSALAAIMKASPDAVGRTAMIGSPMWVILCLASAAIVAFFALYQLRFLIDPRLMSISDDGIEVRSGMVPRRARWVDYRDVEIDPYRAYLVFEKVGKVSKLTLPATWLLGFKYETLIPEMRPRIERARGLPPSGTVAA